MSPDKLTLLLIKAIDSLHIVNVKATSIGILAGVSFTGMRDAIVEVFGSRYGFIKTINGYAAVAFSILVCNLPFLARKHIIDPKIETLIHYTEEIIRKGHYTKEQKQLYWRKLILDVIEGNMSGGPPTVPG